MVKRMPVGVGLDYLVNAAGVAWFGRDGSVLEVEEGLWGTIMAINFDVMRHLSVAAVPLLRRGGGRSMVHVASTAGLRSMDSPLDAYQVSKAAVISLSRTLALTLGRERIRSNTVCPGAVLSPMIAPLTLVELRVLTSLPSPKCSSMSRSLATVGLMVACAVIELGLLHADHRTGRKRYP